MKKIIFLLMILSCFSCLFACKNKQDKSEHEHTYSNDWSFDELYHFHRATCGHNEIKNKAEHNWVDTGITITIATEIIEGEKEQKCSVCGKTKIVKTGVLGHEHTFDMERWSYNEEYHYHCATCGHIGEIVDKESHIWNDGEIVLFPTIENEGFIRYTCIICGAIKTKEIPKEKQTNQEGVWDIIN